MLCRFSGRARARGVRTTVPTASLVLAGASLMTTKAKLAAVAVVCGVLFAALWVPDTAPRACYTSTLVSGWLD